MSKETLIESPTRRSVHEDTDSNIFDENAQNTTASTSGSIGFIPVPSFPSTLEGFLDTSDSLSPEIDDFVESVLVSYALL